MRILLIISMVFCLIGCEDALEEPSGGTVEGNPVEASPGFDCMEVYEIYYERAAASGCAPIPQDGYDPSWDFAYAMCDCETVGNKIWATAFWDLGIARMENFCNAVEEEMDFVRGQGCFSN